MRDTALYEKILGMEAPWNVSSVDLDVGKARVDIELEHGPSTLFPCLKCGVALLPESLSPAQAATFPLVLKLCAAQFDGVL